MASVQPGDSLDRALQQMSDGQTHGIPIGPDASLVMAEALLAAVDSEMLQKRGPSLRGFRYVDDYELSFDNLREAEEALTELQSILAGYSLTLNPRKTAIEELPRGLDDRWALELKALKVRSDAHPIGQRNDLLALFSRAFDFATSYREASVLRYAVSRLQRLSVHATGWRTFQNCILNAAGADPSTMAVALGTLYETSTLGGHAISVGPLSQTFESVIARHAPRAQGSEVAWALWGALAWSAPLSRAAAQHVSAMEDNVVALLALDADARGIFPKGALDKDGWTSTVDQPGVLGSEHWLLAYEANQKGWLPSPAVSKDKDFGAMSAAGIQFYDSTKNIPQFPTAGRSLPGGILPTFYG